MHIRPMMAGDEAALFQVYFSAIHLVATQDYTPEQLSAWAPTDMDMRVWAQKMQSLRPFVAVRADAVVGYADIQPNGYIDHFFVSGPCSRQGIGQQLMARIHEQARTWGVHTLTSNVSLTAEPFFLQHGFQVVERQFPVLQGVTFRNARMRKVIT